MNLDLSNDFDVFDNVEAVTYYRRDLEGAVATYSNVSALKRATVGNLVSLGGPSQGSVNLARWHIKAATLAVVPRRGDRLTSVAHGTWEVLSDSVEAFASRYVCECKQVP